MRAARAVLELGRVSNLPTVWMNCAAAWVLTGGRIDQLALLYLCVAGSLVYLAGTILNDAFDTKFDAEHRKERPIPSGRISLRNTWILGGACLVLGVTTFLLTTRADPVFVLVLAVAVVVYDATHKRSLAGPWVMGSCRLLLYLVAATAAPNGHDLANALVIGAGAGAYVVGLSYVAQGEATGAKLHRWPLLLLSAPVLVGLYAVLKRPAPFPFAALFIFSVWIGIALAVLTDKAKAGRVGKAVGMLLAGLILFDTFMLSFFYPLLIPLFLALFLLTLGLQRLVPAT